MITDLFEGVICPHCGQQSEDYERTGKEEQEGRNKENHTADKERFRSIRARRRR